MFESLLFIVWIIVLFFLSVTDFSSSDFKSLEFHKTHKVSKSYDFPTIENIGFFEISEEEHRQ